MDLTKIKALAENFDGGIKRVAELSGMSEQNLHRCVRCGRMQAGDLAAVAKTLGVPITHFFSPSELAAEPPSRPSCPDGSNVVQGQSGGYSYQNQGGDMTVEVAATEGPGRSKLGEARARALSLEKELRAARKYSDSLEKQIEYLNGALADKDRIIALLSR